MKKIYLRGITNPMSNNEMRNTRGGEDTFVSDLADASPCDKIGPCKGKDYKSSCTYVCNGKTLSGRCCDCGGFTTMHCSDLGDFAC